MAPQDGWSVAIPIIEARRYDGYRCAPPILRYLRCDPHRYDERLTGSIILNTGDYMQRISNDRLPSTTHRVSQPRDIAARSRERISFPLAIYVWEEEMLEVLPGLGEPKYPPVSAIAFHTHTTAKYYGAAYAVDGPEGEKRTQDFVARKKRSGFRGRLTT